MFKNDLQRRLCKIFDVEKITYDAPGDSFEQDTIFIAVAKCTTRVSDMNGGRETAKVEGSLTMYSQNNRLPFGFFNKRIEKADKQYTDNLFFYDIDVDVETSPARMQNIHERRVGFIFLYDSQYDPERGSMTSLDLTFNPPPEE